jgi:hypothetical protein
VHEEALAHWGAVVPNKKINMNRRGRLTDTGVKELF